jgi:hypothetical protein
LLEALDLTSDEDLAGLLYHAPEMAQRCATSLARLKTLMLALYTARVLSAWHEQHAGKRDTPPTERTIRRALRRFPFREPERLVAIREGCSQPAVSSSIHRMRAYIAGVPVIEVLKEALRLLEESDTTPQSLSG